MTAFTDLHPSTRRAVLRRLDMAADLIRQGWTQNASARNAAGDLVFVDSAAATCWCLTGAVRAATLDLDRIAYTVVRSVMKDVSFDLYDADPVYVNDKVARNRRTPLRIIRETKKRLEAQA